MFLHSKVLAHFKVHGRSAKKQGNKPDNRDKLAKKQRKNKKQLFGRAKMDASDASDTSDHHNNAESNSESDSMDDEEVTFTTKFLSDLGTDVDYRLRVDMPVTYTISTIKGLEPHVRGLHFAVQLSVLFVRRSVAGDQFLLCCSVVGRRHSD